MSQNLSDSSLRPYDTSVKSQGVRRQIERVITKRNAGGATQGVSMMGVL
jgi:hypothetical protein